MVQKIKVEASVYTAMQWKSPRKRLEFVSGQPTTLNLVATFSNKGLESTGRKMCPSLPYPLPSEPSRQLTQYRHTS